MEPSERTLLIVGAIALGITLFALIVLPRRAINVRVPHWAVTAGAALLVGLGVGYSAAEFFGLHWGQDKTTEAKPPPPQWLTPTTPTTAPLPPGAKLPPFSKNWLNGPPPHFGDPAVENFVIDLWEHSCPWCRYAAPKLVEVYPKYKERGVRFISFSIMPKNTVQDFVKQFNVEWAFMYEAPGDFVDALGKGTLYLATRDGTILWDDARGRLQHEPTEEYVARVCKALDQFLGAGRQK